MAEYIEREAAKRVFNLHFGGVSHAVIANRLIDEITAADVVAVKRGRWVLRHVGHGHYWECSECHQNPCIYVTKDTNFCPNCGADMREVDHAKT